MTTLTEKQQKLREIINGANPELLKLEFENWLIGKPPTLEHLLIAIKPFKVELTLATDAEMVIEYLSKNVGKTVCVYHLTKNPLDQSEQVIDSLLEILN